MGVRNSPLQEPQTPITATPYFDFFHIKSPECTVTQNVAELAHSFYSRYIFNPYLDVIKQLKSTKFISKLPQTSESDN